MYKCEFCNKTYVKPKNLKNHYIKCSIVNNMNILGCSDELFGLLRNLTQSNIELTNRVKKLETLSYKEKRKIDVLDWLNKNRESVTFERFISGIELCNKELEIIYEVGIIDGIIEIINQKLKQMNEKPLICFERKSYNLYVKDINGWVLMKDKDFKKYMCYFQKQILKLFRENNPITSLKSDKEHNMYNKRLMKICVENFSTKVKTIRNEIYRINKINIDKIIKYDFVF